MKRLVAVALLGLHGLTCYAGDLIECAFNLPACAAVAERVGPAGALATIGDAWATAWFDGFVMGIALANRPQWCPPGGVFSGIQLSAIVSQYVRENPKTWNQGPQLIVLQALAQAYPCKK
jgi:hypothetical protein